ncbi:MAG TPA: murein biosynthesis integral membrane protein MurJ [Jatrophihabitans sp.]|jgi:putative peptidoglycan lipid II flippase
MSDQWSTPSLYSGRGRAVEPRTFTEADPISAMLVADWLEDPDQVHENPWSSTTYVGPRRRRPDRRRRRGTATTEAPPEPGAPETAAPAGVAEEEVEGNRRVLANSRAMAIASLVSRITGFLRSALLVAALGVGHVGDAYNLGNNFPNMVYELLLGGVLSSVLVPLLVNAQEDDADEGVAYTQRLLSLATVALSLVTMLAVVCAPLIASGFVDPGPQRSLTSLFATLLLPEIFFYGLGAMFMAVLNIRHSYAPGAWAPVLNNVIMIVTVAVFFALPGPNVLTPSSMTTAQVVVLGVGTTLGIAAQALVLIPALRRTGFHWKWRFRANPDEAGRLREVGQLAGWVLCYVVASQIGVTVIAAVGGHNKAFTVFTQADLLIQMPYGILVVSLLTALMPRLSRAAAREQHDEVIADLGLGARLSAIALVPITAGLIVLGQSLTIVLFAHGQTSIEGGRLIGTALAASAFGLFPFALVMLQLRVFYAMRDGRTPTLINVFMVGTKIVIVLVCSHLFDDTGRIAVALTVATSTSYVIGAVVGHICLTRRLGNLGFRSVADTVARVTLASAAGGAAAFGVGLALRSALGDGRSGALATLLLGGAAGVAVLVAVLWRMRISELQDLTGLVRRR